MVSIYLLQILTSVVVVVKSLQYMGDNPGDPVFGQTNNRSRFSDAVRVLQRRIHIKKKRCIYNVYKQLTNYFNQKHRELDTIGTTFDFRHFVYIRGTTFKIRI